MKETSAFSQSFLKKGEKKKKLDYQRTGDDKLRTGSEQSPLNEKMRFGQGGERKASQEGDGGEGAACFEVSPRWPEEVKSHVTLQVNVQNKGHLLPEENSQAPRSWTAAWQMPVKNVIFKTLKGAEQSSATAKG